MKLRNKQTGEIVSLEGELLFDNKVMLLKQYNSLAELNKDWEDYEEPKDHWHIGCEGDVFIDNTERNLRSYSLIGNDFLTKEETEKAVEKLKAWKRLKDRGFKFEYVHLPLRTNPPHSGYINYEIGMSDIESEKDLDLLFSGGEE